MDKDSNEDYRKRLDALSKIRDALETSEDFDGFISALERQGMPEDRSQRLVAVPVDADFHLHSNYSDGKIPARKLAWLARAMGLKIIGLADHDNIDGCREIYREGTLLGVSVIPGVELSTGRPGCEILVYFPLPGRFFEYLSSPKSDSFIRYLKEKQKAIHDVTLKVLERLNSWLKRHGIEDKHAITIEEIEQWFGGQEPFYPGTLCVLGLKRLDTTMRESLKITDPRTFNTKVISPILSRLGYAFAAGDKGLDQVFQKVRSLRRAGAAPVTVLAHPKELVTKGKLSLGKVHTLVESLVRDHGLDGIEVSCARDNEVDVRYWCEMASEINERIGSGEFGKRRKALLMSSFSSDFHVLAPGLATGEITLGFGMLDERPANRRGNLRPIGSPEEFVEALKHRAASSA